MRSCGEHNKFPARWSKEDPPNEQGHYAPKYYDNKHTQFLTGIKEE
jgi:hypothetical protein